MEKKNMTNEANEVKETKAKVEEAVVDTDAAVQTILDTAREEIEGDEIVTSFLVKREKFSLKGNGETRICYSYFLNGELPPKKAGGVPVPCKVNFAPKDKKDVGAYAVLDYIFQDDNDECMLIIKPFKISAEKRGEGDIKGIRYIIASPMNFDVLRVAVKPDKDSDKALLDLLFHFNGYKKIIEDWYKR